MTDRQKKAIVHTLGCRLNQSETAVIAAKLKRAGYTIVPFGEPTDLGIINTCTVTHEADAKSRKLVRAFIRKNPHAFTAVIGCYSQLASEAISEIEGVDLIVGHQEKLNVLDYVAEKKNARPRIVQDSLSIGDFSAEPGAPDLTSRPMLKIQDGCDFMCSYCIVPFARGRSRSREMENLAEEAETMARNGAKEIVLTGVNIGTYNYNGQTVLDVADILNSIDGIERVRISSIDMTTVPDGLFNRMNDPHHALVPFLHIPAQSGSNGVLERMNRKYTREEYLGFVNKADDSVTDLCIGTDILVGMPGETEEEFGETCSLLAESPIAYAHVFKYSERKGTPAAKFPGKVDTETINSRSVCVRRISNLKRRHFNERYIGKTLEVLFEEVKDGLWHGYTENYIRVAARSEEALANIIRPVTMQTVCGKVVEGQIHGE